MGLDRGGLSTGGGSRQGGAPPDSLGSKGVLESLGSKPQ